MEKVSCSIDRIEESTAVLVDENSQPRYTASVALLPKQAREGDWVIVTVEDDRVISVQTDPEAKKRAEQRIQSKLDRLRRESSSARKDKS